MYIFVIWYRCRRVKVCLMASHSLTLWLHGIEGLARSLRRASANAPYLRHLLTLAAGDERGSNTPPACRSLRRLTVWGNSALPYPILPGARRPYRAELVAVPVCPD